MSDEIQAPGADTPEPTLTDTTDWEKRYNDLQPEYTRKSQRLSQLESDPNALIEWVQQHHPDLLDSGDTEPDIEQEYDDTEDDEVRRELAELKQWREEQTQAQTAAETRAEWDGWEAYVKDLASKDGVELTGRDIKALKIDSASNNGRPVTPDKAEQALKAHLDDLRAYEEQLIERSRTKRKRAPQVPGDGSTATQTPDLDTHQSRVAHMVQQYADLTSD